MSHNIFEHDKQQGIAQAWHGLTEVHPELSFSMPGFWLNAWDGFPVQMKAEIPAIAKAKGIKAQPARVVASDFRIMVATDKPDLLIGRPFNPKSYKPVYNREFVAMAENLCKKFPGTKVVSNGSLRNRRRVFITLQLPESDGGKVIAGGREFLGLFNLLNSFDQSAPVLGVGSNTCTVCDNTFSANMAKAFGDDETSAAIGRHKIGLDLGALEKAMIEAIKYQLGFANKFEKLAAQKIDANSAIYAFAAFVGEKRAALTTRSANIVERLQGMFLKGSGNDGDDYADWFQAVTQFYTHESATSANDAEGKAKQYLSSEFGTGARTKAAAWELINNAEQFAKAVKSGEELWRNWQTQLAGKKWDK